MAAGKFVIKDAVALINSVDLSARVAHVEVIMASDDVDVSTMGTGVHEHLAGLRADSFVVTFLSDFGAAMVDATIAPLQATADSTPEFPVSISAFSGGASTTNPVFSSTACILLNYSPISGDIGARSETQVTFPSNAAIVRNVS